MAGYAMDLRNARAQEIIDLIGAAGRLLLYAGTRPATGGVATGTLLASVLLKNPAGSLNTGTATITLTKPDDVQAIGAGTCTWARITDGTDPLIDLSVSDTMGSGEIKLNELNITVGLWVSVQSVTVVEGNP